jgi:hypothetical protein
VPKRQTREEHVDPETHVYASCINGRSCCHLCSSGDTGNGGVAVNPTVVGAWSSGISINTGTNPRVEESIAWKLLTVTNSVDVTCVCKHVGLLH